MASYVTKETPQEVVSKVLEVLTIAKDTGVVRKGANETTKCIEKGNAQLVAIAADVDPPEVVVHLPILCDEKDVFYVFIPTKKDLGQAIGINVGCAAATIENPGNAAELMRDIIEGAKKKALKAEKKEKEEKKEEKLEKEPEEKKEEKTKEEMKVKKEKPKKGEEKEEKKKEKPAEEPKPEEVKEELKEKKKEEPKEEAKEEKAEEIKEEEKKG